jgi:arginyl-tRNA synthetase
MVALSHATARELGYAPPPDSEDAKRPFVEVSGRKGLGVKADDLLDALQSKATEAVGEGSKREGLTDADVAELGRQIAVGALRYFMLKYGRNKVIAFDFNEALTFEGDSGPYLQYSTVRVQNIFRKMVERGVDARLDDLSLDALTLTSGLSDEMWDLVRRSADLPVTIRRAIDALELSIVTHDLFELAQRFNSFYHKYPILNEKDDAERQRRAVCAEVFRQTMIASLDLLGIPVPERM